MEIEKILCDICVASGIERPIVIKTLEDLKTKPSIVRQFYLYTARFPGEKEDDFLVKHGFEAWHDAYKFLNQKQ